MRVDKYELEIRGDYMVLVMYGDGAQKTGSVIERARVVSKDRMLSTLIKHGQKMAKHWNVQFVDHIS